MNDLLVVVQDVLGDGNPVGAPPALRVSGPSGNDGTILTDLLCDESGNCFSPAAIAADNSANPADGTAGDGMKCPAGEYMVGIEDGAAVCEAVYLG